MEINKIHDITFDTNETIITSTLASLNELVMLMSSGNVIRYKINEPNGQQLFTVKSDIEYADGGFDINSKSTIYTLDEIVVIVNDYKRHGFIHYPKKYHALHLWREDYCADISCYPIILFKSEKGIPHIIYAVGWNHLQIMNLDTRQVLTASKSLIEENAEESHIEFYKKHTDDNKLSWPSPYDYFFGKLLLAPNQKKFLSAGWSWGSCDSYKVYDIERFISSNRITDLSIGNWEHENRATCWVDDKTIAILYNPITEGDENSTSDSPWEIHFYKIGLEGTETDKKIKIMDLDLSNSTMHYDSRFNSIIAFSDKIGLTIIALDGQILFHDNNLKIDDYDLDKGYLLKTENKNISVYEIKL